MNNTVNSLESSSTSITYHREEVDGVGIFYREAGPKDAPILVLLHGFPSSSRMYETLIPLLAPRYHVIAPDYPSFGFSDAPPPAQYDYTFDHLAETMNKFLDKLGIGTCSFYLSDYGGPIGFRMLLAKPERLQALIIQNANAYTEGLGSKWKNIAAYWENPQAHPEQAVAFTSLKAAWVRHAGDSPNPERYCPSLWEDEFTWLSKPGQQEIQETLLYDYRTNVASYPSWQAWLRQHQPPTLIAWGGYDSSFIAAGALAYQRDLPEAEIHVLDAGHFALDEKLDEIAMLILAFLPKHV